MFNPRPTSSNSNNHTPETPLILSLQQTQELQLSHNVIKTNIPVVHLTASSLQYTLYRKNVNSVQGRQHNHFMSIVLWEEIMWKYCGCHLVLTFYMCYTQTVLSQIRLTQSCWGNSSKDNIMYWFRKLWVLPFPLKVNTNNKQLALVKWNNVFFFSIQFIQK